MKPSGLWFGTSGFTRRQNVCWLMRTFEYLTVFGLFFLRPSADNGSVPLFYFFFSFFCSALSLPTIPGRKFSCCSCLRMRVYQLQMYVLGCFHSNPFRHSSIWSGDLKAGTLTVTERARFCRTADTRRSQTRHVDRHRDTVSTPGGLGLRLSLFLLTWSSVGP